MQYSMTLESVLAIVATILLAIFAVLVLFRFFRKVSIGVLAEKNSIIRIQDSIISKIMNDSTGTFFIIRIEDGTIRFSENMETRFGWKFPDRLTSNKMEDPAMVWQVWDTDVDKLRQMFTDVFHEGKDVEAELGLLNVNMDYPRYLVSMSAVMNQKNHTEYIIGSIKNEVERWYTDI